MAVHSTLFSFQTILPTLAYTAGESVMWRDSLTNRLWMEKGRFLGEPFHVPQLVATAYANGNGTTLSLGGLSSTTSTGTNSAVNVTANSDIRGWRRFRVTSSGGTNNSASRRGNALIISSAVATMVEFWLSPRTETTPVATSRWFVGIAPTTGLLATTTDPSSVAQIAGFGGDSGDTDVYFMHSGASTPATKVSSGLTENDVANGAYFRLEISATGEYLFYIALFTTTTVQRYSTSSSIPDPGIYNWHTWRNNGSAGGAVAMDFCGMRLRVGR